MAGVEEDQSTTPGERERDLVELVAMGQAGQMPAVLWVATFLQEERS